MKVIKEMKAKFGFGEMSNVALVAVLGIATLTIGAKVVSDIAGTMGAGTAEKNLANSGLTLFANIGNNLGLVGTVLGLGLVIAVLVSAFVANRR